MRRALPVLLLAAYALAPASLASQTQWENQVLSQIRTAGNLFQSDGFRLQGEAHTGTLAISASEDFPIFLEAGVTYAFIGVCDADCADIDLSIADQYGEVVDSDYQDDDVPVLEVTPRASGQYRVHVYMADCSAEPCYYGVGTFASGEAAETNEWQDQVDSQILTAGSLFANEGYSVRGAAHSSSLDQGASEEFTILLQKGTTYALIAVCDADCSDIDLMLSDASGETIDSDYEEDDVPIVQVTARRTAMYTVHVYMASCNTEPCFYGVGTFARK